MTNQAAAMLRPKLIAAGVDERISDFLMPFLLSIFKGVCADPATAAKTDAHSTARLLGYGMVGKFGHKWYAENKGRALCKKMISVASELTQEEVDLLKS